MVLINNIDIEQYITKNEYNYLLKTIGSEDHISYILSNQNNTRNLIADLSNDITLLNIFHNIYKKVKDNNDLKNSELLKCLITLDIARDNLQKQINNIQTKKYESIVHAPDVITLKIQDRINNMKTINDINNDCKYADLLKQISDEKKLFSLDKEFSNNASKYNQGLNAVTVITPSQTISRFNDESVNGLIGSGHHDANFSQIVNSIYNHNFKDAISTQDIKIRYVTYMTNEDTLQCLMTLEIPLFINSTQKISLINLNNEIKKYEEQNNQKITIHAMITDYTNKNYYQNIYNQNNLDEIIKQLVINDEIKYQYIEQYFIGYSNLENHYNKQTKNKIG